MKRKLLLAALFVVSALGFNAKAQGSLEAGTYYLYNVEAGKYVSAGAYWGTRSVLTEHGVDFTVSKDGETYTLITKIVGANKALRPTDGYMDQSGTWSINAVGDGTYTILGSNGYYRYDGTSIPAVDGTLSDSGIYWEFRTKDELSANLSSATIDSPVDATHFIKAPDFVTNDYRITGEKAWTGLSKYNNGYTTFAGDVGSGCTLINNVNAQSWNTTPFDINQTLTGLPQGTYKLSAYGFYRYGSNDGAASARANGTEVLNAVMYAGDASIPLMSVLDGAGTNGNVGVSTSFGYVPNNQGQAASYFDKGNYADNELIFYVGEEGTVKIGVKKDAGVGNDWTVFDNFDLQYYGNVTINKVKLVKAYNEAMDAAMAYQSADMFDEDKIALNTAISENTLDLSTATEESLTTATNNLKDAATAAEMAKKGYLEYFEIEEILTNGVGSATIDLTSILTNPGFETGNTEGWTNSGTIEARAQGNSSFDNKKGSYYAERWHAGGSVDINQTLHRLPAGIYKISAYVYSDTPDAILYANDTKVPFTASGQYSVLVEVSDKGSLKFGTSCTLTGNTWICLDEFTLTYMNELPPYELAEGKMNKDVATAQKDAETAFTGNKTVANYNALLAAINNAQASVNAYAAAKAEIDKAKETLNSTNVYTAEAYTAFKGAIDAAQAKYDESTMTTAEANGLANILNNTDAALVRNYVTGAWTATNSANIYTNNWSWEGDAEGSSGMKTPFIEYFVADANKLADTEISATLPVEDGLYSVTAFVRLFNNKTAEGDTGYEGVSFRVNNGTVVPFADATVYSDGVAKEVTFEGLVKDGNLVIKAIVSGTNISWLAMKNVKYTKVRDLTEEEKAVVPTGITLDKTEVALNTETTTVTLVPTFSPDNATTTVTWTSSAATVATVDAYGVVTALSSGTTTITVASTLNPEAKATATVTVTFPETAMPESSYVNDGPKRSITTVTGENLIKNGTFEYPNGFYGWTNGAGGNIDATNFAIVDGALNAKNSNGAGYAASIDSEWSIEAGKTYVFAYKVKGNPTNSKYMVVSLANDPASTDENNKISDDNTPVTNEWSEVKYVFTNTEGYAYLQFRARWLGSSVHFDDFYLAEVTTTEVGNVEYATAAIPTANIGEGVFQYSQTAIDAANALVQGTATVDDVQNAYNALQVLNAPDADTRYAAVLKEGGDYNNMAITYIAGGRTDAGGYNIQYLKEQNANYAQAFKFTPVEGQLNTYLMSQIDNDGVERYISTGKPHGGAAKQIRTVTDSEDALKIKVIATATDEIINLKNTEDNNNIGSRDQGVYTTSEISDKFSIVVAQPAEVTLNSDGGYYTLMLPFAAELPAGMKAYTCAEVNGNVLALTDAASFAPNTPYIVEGGEGKHTFSGYGLATKDSYEGGLLTGVYADTEVPAGSYVLQEKDGNVKFYLVSAGENMQPTLSPYRAYLTVQSAGVKAFSFGGETTGINGVETLTDGAVESIFTISGTRVNSLQKGLNIVKMSNGKTQKVLVK